MTAVLSFHPEYGSMYPPAGKDWQHEAPRVEGEKAPPRFEFSVECFISGCYTASEITHINVVATGRAVGRSEIRLIPSWTISTS